MHITFIDVNDKEDEGCITVEWDAVPRVDESVILKGIHYSVVEVIWSHRMPFLSNRDLDTMKVQVLIERR